MSRSDQVYIDDIKESIATIFTYAEGKTEADFSSNQMLQDAVIRRFEIIGEAVSKISNQFINQHAHIQWRLIKSMRNKLIHEYFGVSVATIYATIQIDLPLLKQQLEELSK